MTWLRWPAAAAGGWLLAWSFPPHGWWWAVIPALALLLGALNGAGSWRGAAIGWLGAFVFFAALLQWLRVVGPDAWVLLAAVQALYVAVLGAVVGRLPFRHPLTPAVVAGLWVAMEGIRGRLPFGGFTWGRVGFASADAPVARWVAYGGVAAVTFACVLSAGLLVCGVTRLLESRGTPTQRWDRVAAAALVAAVAVAVLAPPLPAFRPDGSAPAAIVQGNVPRAGLDFLGQRRQVVRNHAAATEALAAQVAAGTAPQPALVLWPENSTDLDPYSDATTRDLIDSAVTAIDAPTLVGAVVVRPDGRLANTSIVWLPNSGPSDVYVKRHPVPFGEFVPFRSVLERFISRLDRVPRDFVAGTEPGVLQLGPAKAAVVICFEIAEDSVVDQHVAGGGQFIAVQTNNATYGRTGQPEQQLEISRLRAMEHSRVVAIAATSGISGVIAPDGSVTVRTEEFTQATLSTDLALSNALTPATRYARGVEIALAVWGLVGTGILILWRRRTSGATTEGTA